MQTQPHEYNRAWLIIAGLTFGGAGLYLLFALVIPAAVAFATGQTILP